MSDDNLRYRAASKLNAQVDELIGLCRGIAADGTVNQLEVEYLQKWAIANSAVIDNPVFSKLFSLIEDVLADGVLDEGEALALYESLIAYTANDFEIGEVFKATTLPLCSPAPEVLFEGRFFCVTGTFSYGARKLVNTAIEERGGCIGNVTRKLDYLVIGEYATDSWSHSSYGGKIEKAVELRSKGCQLSIVSEAHWKNYL